MKRLLVLSLFLGITCIAFSQAQEAPDSVLEGIYRQSYTRINDLVHTKLDVKFDYAKSYLYGKAWITLKPHFYTTDSLLLDAKGMDIHKLAVVNGKTMTPLKYDYNGMLLNIKLDKAYKGGEN